MGFHWVTERETGLVGGGWWVVGGVALRDVAIICINGDGGKTAIKDGRDFPGCCAALLTPEKKDRKARIEKEQKLRLLGEISLLCYVPPLRHHPFAHSASAAIIEFNALIGPCWSAYRRKGQSPTPPPRPELQL